MNLVASLDADVTRGASGVTDPWQVRFITYSALNSKALVNLTV